MTKKINNGLTKCPQVILSIHYRTNVCEGSDTGIKIVRT